MKSAYFLLLGIVVTCLFFIFTYEPLKPSPYEKALKLKHEIMQKADEIRNLGFGFDVRWGQYLESMEIVPVEIKIECKCEHKSSGVMIYNGGLMTNGMFLK